MNGGGHPFYKIQDKRGPLASYVYGDFGETLERSGPMADVFPHRFSTKYHDGETGFYYYGFRFYNPELKRWLNRDPIGEEGGVNLYGFCGNNGASQIDSLGENVSNLEILHNGKANVADNKYLDFLRPSEAYYTEMIKGDLGGRGKLLENVSALVADPYSLSIGLSLRRRSLPDAAAALYKFEYKVTRICVDRSLSSYSDAELWDGTYKTDNRFSLKQTVVLAESSVTKRKTGSNGEWSKPWIGPKFHSDDRPSLVTHNPQNPEYGQEVITYAGDALRINVPPNKGSEYKLICTWIVTAKDKNNVWTGKHRITITMSDSDPASASFNTEIIDSPREVR